MPRAGWKICVNDAAMQKKLGMETSFVGFLDGSRSLRSGEVWTVGEGAILGAEPEFALRFGARVEPGMRADAVRRAIASAAPAIEVVDWSRAKFDLAALAESSSFHAGFVVGQPRALETVPRITASCPRFSRGDDVIGTPDPHLVPADLAGLVLRVSAFLARYDESIEDGDWLLCGACTNPARVEAGATIEADFAELGGVRVRFEA